MLQFLKIFCSVFTAELGDKTQIATVGFAATAGVWKTFGASAAALVLTSLLGSLLGGLLEGRLNPRYTEIGSGILFLAIGAWTLIGALRG